MKRPNILILYTDQQRWDALGANGNDEIHHAKPGCAGGARHKLQAPLCAESGLHAEPGQHAVEASYPSTLGITHMGVPVPEDLDDFATRAQAVRLSDGEYRQAALSAARQSRSSAAASNRTVLTVLEIADEPGVYEDAYRAWVRRQAPEQMDGISAGLPPNTSVWQRAMGIEDGIGSIVAIPKGGMTYKRRFPSRPMII